MSSNSGFVKIETTEHGLSRSGLEFRYESNSSKIISILEKRLPKSANIYNMCKIYDKLKKPEEMGFYIVCSVPVTTDKCKDSSDGMTLEENVWVLATYYREDYGMRYAISAPPNAIITSEIKEAFVQCPYIDWNEPYHFACIDFEISTMIYEISTKSFGNYVTSMPCKIFSMSTSEAANLDVTFPDSFSNELVLQPMDGKKGVEFFSSTWKYAVPQKSEVAIEKLLSRNKSIGLYDQRSGNVLCGMCINDCGLMGMLHTLPDQRGKGYAKLVTQKLIKSFAEESGAFPCSAVEIKNYQSLAFHEKLGMKVSHCADFIKYVPQKW